ncbi:hypothetical protein [Tsuneonella aeria]|nr:hypothetical protein [Tsuneonella aeria]
MTKTNNHIAAFCAALLLTLTLFQQTIVVPVDRAPGFATAVLA